MVIDCAFRAIVEAIIAMAMSSFFSMLIAFVELDFWFFNTYTKLTAYANDGGDKLVQKG
jgi:hypothetical protein